MKKICAAASVTILMIFGAAWAQQTTAYDDRPKIAVNGEAVVNVKPDKIIITLGIETSDTDMAAAKQKNSDIMKKTMAAMKGLGVPEREIQTDYLSIEPRWKNDYSRENFLGYFVRNTLVVTLSDAAKVEKLITDVLQAGVNYIHGIDFQTIDFKKYREQARELALKAAKEKAAKMAAVLGQSIGLPIQITESYSGSPWWYWSSWSGWGYGRSRAMSQNVAQEEPGGSGEMGDTVALGKISIRAAVTVTFELKK